MKINNRITQDRKKNKQLTNLENKKNELLSIKVEEVIKTYKKKVITRR